MGDRLKGKITKEEYEWQMNPLPPEAVGESVAYLACDESPSDLAKAETRHSY